jgi:16S rRNA (uracil1498-N3)-methyltransferase
MTIRIYFDTIKLGEKIELNSIQTHYLFKVMRVQANDVVHLFNKNNGEFACKIHEISKNQCIATPEKLIKQYTERRKIICVFSLIRQKNIEIIIQKCTEIGVHAFLPLKTQRSINDEINISRLNTIAIEASEQCGRLDIPEIRKPVSINTLLGMQQAGRAFVLLNQEGSGAINGNCDEIFVICGPEGGFTENEIESFSKFCQKVKISENILRAETAAILGCGIAMQII